MEAYLGHLWKKTLQKNKSSWYIMSRKKLNESVKKNSLSMIDFFLTPLIFALIVFIS